MKIDLPTPKDLGNFMYIEGIKNLTDRRMALAILEDYREVYNLLKDLPNTELEALETVLIDAGERIVEGSITRDKWFMASLRHKALAMKLLEESHPQIREYLNEARETAWLLWEHRMKGVVKSEVA